MLRPILTGLIAEVASWYMRAWRRAMTAEAMSVIPRQTMSTGITSTLPLVRRKLAEIRAKKVRKRPRGIDAFIPPGEGRALRAFYNRRAHDGDGQIAAAARKNGFSEAFRERISIWPAQVLSATQANASKPVPGPARAIALQNPVEFSGRRCRFVAAASERLAAKRLIEFGAFGAPLHIANCFAQRLHFALGIKFGIPSRIVVFLQLFGDPVVAHPDNVARGKVHQPGVLALSQEVEQVNRRINIGRDRVTQIRIKIRQAGAVHD